MKKIKLVVITLISLLLIACVPVFAENETQTPPDIEPTPTVSKYIDNIDENTYPVKIYVGIGYNWSPDESAPYNLSGAKIMVKDSNGLEIDTKTTNDDGYAEFYLKTGNYNAFLTEVPDGYRISEYSSAHPMIINPWPMEYHTLAATAFERISEQPGVTVIDQNGMPVVNATVKIKHESSVRLYSGEISEITTTTDGTGKISPTPIFGKYTYKLLSVPDGYKINDKAVVQDYYMGATYTDKTIVVEKVGLDNGNGTGTTTTPTANDNDHKSVSELNKSSDNPNTGNEVENLVVVLALLTSLLVATVSYVKVKKIN